MVHFPQTKLLVFFVVACLGLQSLSGVTPGGGRKVDQKWPAGRMYSLKGLEVTVSAPVLVGRSQGYFWMPTVVRLSNGDLLAGISNQNDDVHDPSTELYSWSSNGGLTWSSPIEGEVFDIGLPLPSGDELLLPFYLNPLANDDLKGHYQISPRGRREIKLVKEGLTISGWPRPVGWGGPGDERTKRLGLAPWVFEGQSVQLKNGAYLATLYGDFQGDEVSSVAAAESRDGVHWKIRSIIADATCCQPLKNGNGPSEPSLCRLADGRLMCVVRLQGRDMGYAAGQTWSDDDGKTWSKPITMAPDVFPVQPSLAVMKKGTVVLSGGRPGLYAWFNADGTGRDWQRVDMMAHHDAFAPKDPMKEVLDKEQAIKQKVKTEFCRECASFRTSAYTEVVKLDDTHALYIYDRIPYGWYPIPKGSPETNSVWAVRMTVRKN